MILAGVDEQCAVANVVGNTADDIEMEIRCKTKMLDAKRRLIEEALLEVQQQHERRSDLVCMYYIDYIYTLMNIEPDFVKFATIEITGDDAESSTSPAPPSSSPQMHLEWSRVAHRFVCSAISITNNQSYVF